MMHYVKTLTIAGSDSGGGAGIQADIKNNVGFRVLRISVITAVTAQNTKQVFCVQSVEATVVESQLRAVLTDLRPNAIKNRYGWLCKEYRNYCAGIGSIQDGSTRYRPCNGFYIWQ